MFTLKHVKTSTRKLTFVESADQVGFVDMRALPTFTR